MAELGTGIIKMIFDLWAYRIEQFGPSFTEFKCLS